MRKHITREECDTTEEICALFNEQLQELRAMDLRVSSLENAKPKEDKKPKDSKAAKAAMLVAMLVMGLFVTVAPVRANYGPSDITYDAVSNPDSLQRLLSALFDNYQGTSVLFDPQTTAPTAAEGKVYYNDTANALYLSTDGSTWTIIDAGSGTSLDGAYDLGSKIDVDGTVLELEVDNNANNAALLLDMDDSTNNPDVFQITNAGTGDAISINGASTGNLIYDENGNFTVSSAGVVTFVGGTSTGDLQVTGSSYNINFDVSRNQLSFADNAVLGIGGADNAAGDVTFKWDASNLLIEAAADNTGQIRLGSTNSMDFVVYGSTNTTSVLFDVSGALLTTNGWTVNIQDDDDLTFGDSSEFVIEYDEDDTDNLFIVAATANDGVQIGDGTTATDLILQSTADAAAQVMFDASGDTANGQMLFGADDHGIDAIFYGATSGSSIAWDQSADDLIVTAADILFLDSGYAKFGTGSDVTFQFDGTNFELFAAAADTPFAIGGTTYGFDTTVYFETAGTIDMDYDGDNMTFSDAISLIFGTDGDWSLRSGTAKALDITPATSDESSVINVGANTAGADLKLFGATTGEYFLWDASADSILPNCGNALFTMTDAEADQFKVDATGTVAGYAIVLETTAGGVQINADGATQGDIAVDAADDMTLTAGGDLTLAVTGTVSAGGSAFTNITSSYELFTDDDTLLASESGKICVSDGSGTAANVIITLPTAAAGLYFTFIDANATAADDLYVKAGTGDTINGGTAGQYLACKTDSAGQSVTLVAVDATRWLLTSSVGTWVADDTPD